MERRELAADKNFTRLYNETASWWKNPRTTIIQVESLVVAGVVLLLILFIFGPSRRWSTNAVMKGVVWVAYTILFSLVSFTLGMMHSLPVKHEQYPVWATCLLLVLGCTNSLTAYDLDDNKRYRSHLAQLLHCMAYVVLIFYFFGEISKGNFTTLAMYACTSNVLRISSCILAITGRGDPTELIAAYMESEFMPRDELDEHDPASLKGYNYPVLIEKGKKPKVPCYRRRSIQKPKIITVHSIWSCRGELLRSTTGKQLRDVCLSFALYQQLKGHFFGFICVKGNGQKSRDFVLQGLLSGEDGYERAFRVIEVELAFLYDFFFTRYAFLHTNTPSFTVYVEGFLKLLYIGSTMGLEIGFLINNKNQSKDEILKSTTTDVAVTEVILALLFFVELSQIILYWLSDWARVTRLCRYVENPSKIKKYWVKSVEFVNIVRRFKLGTCRIHWYWQKQIGQYSLIHMANRGSLLKRLANMVPIPAKCINIHPYMKKAIVFTLQASNIQLTNGKSSLQRYGVLYNLSWACHLETQIHTIMVWHIATSYYEIASDATQIGEEGNVAIELSRYCMHLVANVPELLPENQMYTKVIFAKVKKEATKFLKEATTIQDVYQKMSDLQVPQDTHKVFEMGVRLGRQLESMEDRVLMWNMLAEFWVELILYIAPSDNIRGHMERLAQGGEFLSHLWALLWHAGKHNHT